MLSPGVNPRDVRGTKTGVFVGSIVSESYDAWTFDMDKIVGYELIGSTTTMFANRLSFFFDFKGQSSKDVHFSLHNHFKMQKHDDLKPSSVIQKKKIVPFIYDY